MADSIRNLSLQPWNRDGSLGDRPKTKESKWWSEMNIVHVNSDNKGNFSVEISADNPVSYDKPTDYSMLKGLDVDRTLIDSDRINDGIVDEIIEILL